jgi:hypothetical protein
MTRRSRLWLLVAAGVFTFVNAGGAVIAAIRGEFLHTLTHVALLLATYAVWRFATTRRGRWEPTAIDSPEAQLDRLEQSVDAIAIDMERIGEAQRFMVKLQEERARTET